MVILWSIFILGGLHYLFSLATLTKYSRISNDVLHLLDSEILAEISAVAFLGICFIELLKNHLR